MWPSSVVNAPPVLTKGSGNGGMVSTASNNVLRGSITNEHRVQPVSMVDVVPPTRSVRHACTPTWCMKREICVECVHEVVTAETD